MLGLVAALTHPSGVVQDFGVRPAVVGRVGVGVVAQSGQHGGDDGHVPHHVGGDLPHPLGQGLHIDGLDDLVCGPLHPGQTDEGKNLKSAAFGGRKLVQVGASTKTGRYQRAGGICFCFF